MAIDFVSQFYSPYDKILHELKNFTDMPDNWLLGSFVLFYKFVGTGWAAGYASVWVAPKEHHRVVFYIIAIMCLLSFLAVTGALLGLFPYGFDGYSPMRFALESFANYIGILLGAAMAWVR